MININGLWAVEWSNSQKAFNVQTLDEAIKANWYSSYEKKPSDWLILGVANNHAEANSMCHQLREKLNLNMETV